MNDLHKMIQEESRKAINDIVIKQSLIYYLLNNFLKFLCIIIGWIFISNYNFGYYVQITVGIVVMLLFLRTIYNFFYFISLKYIVTDQQIIKESGVFVRTTNYLELYRVYDYIYQQTLIGRFSNIMNITILSRDLTNSKLTLIGIKNNPNLISEIRLRVEYNKKLKSVLELNNFQ